MADKLSYHAESVLQNNRVVGSGRILRRGNPLRVHWSPRPNQDTSSWTSRGLLEALRQAANSPGEDVICIVEDITWEWKEQIRRGLKIDTAFFESHFDQRCYLGSHPWHWAIGSEQRHKRQTREENQQWRSIDGTYSLPRQTPTRISYYRLENHIYIFLVDGPPTIPSDQSAPDTRRKPRGRNRTSLRLRYSTLLYGIILPGHFDQEHPVYDLFSVLKSSMKHKWLRDCLFINKTSSDDRPSAVRAHPFVYALIDAAWTYNLRLLTDQVKDVSFSNVEKPHMDTVLVMHELREDLDYLKSEVEKAVRYAPPNLAEYFQNCASSDRDRADGLPLVFLEQMQRDAAGLDEFLTNSLNLLLATIALRDSERAEMLTWLAAVYVPLSFVTSIFGMNLRELSDPSPPVWLCLEVLGVVLLVTAAMVLLYKYGGRVVTYVSRSRRDTEQFSEHRRNRSRIRP